MTLIPIVQGIEGSGNTADPLTPQIQFIGDDGGFSFSELPWGGYVLVCECGSFAARERVGLYSPDFEHVFVDLRLERSGTIAGHVVTVDGIPIRDAVVEPVEARDEYYAVRMDELTPATTGKDGAFVLAGLPPCEWRVVVKKASYSSLISEFLPIDGGPETLVLTSGKTLRGIVLNFETHQPVPGVPITFAPDIKSAGAVIVETDARGAFQVADLAELMYTLTTKNSPFVFRVAPVRVDMHDDTQELLELEVCSGGGIRGRVYVQANSEVVPGATVYVTAENDDVPQRHVTSDASGKYEVIGLPSGVYQVSLGRLPLGLTQSTMDRLAPLDVNVGEIIENVDFVVENSSVIRGDVLDAMGLPAPFVHVEARLKFGSVRSGSTQSDGTYSIAGFREGDQVYVQARSKTAKSLEIGPLPVSSEGLSEIRLVLNSPVDGVIAGIVVDESGTPKRAGIRCLSVEEPTSSFHSEDIRSDVDGNFVIKVATPGEYRLQCGEIGAHGIVHGFIEAGTYSLASGESRTRLRIVSGDDDGWIEGTVVDMDGAPIGGAQVTTIAQGTTQGGDGVLSDQDGGFRLSGLEDDVYRIAAFHPRLGSLQVNDVPVNTEDLRIVLPRPGEVSGVILSASTRSPISTFQVALVVSGAGNVPEHRFQRVVDPMGQFRIAQQPVLLSSEEVQVYALVVQANGYESQMVEIGELTSGSIVSGVEVLLARAERSIEGLVVSQDGSPVQSALIFEGRIESVAGIRASVSVTQTDSDGRFLIEQLQPNTVELTATFGQEAITVSPLDGEADVQIVLRPVCRLEGVVLLGGIPVSSARIRVRASGIPPIKTDDQGRFQVEGLAAGAITIAASYINDETTYVAEGVAELTAGGSTEISIVLEASLQVAVPE